MNRRTMLDFALLLTTLAWAVLSVEPAGAQSHDNDWMATPYEAVIWLSLPEDQEIRHAWQQRLPELMLARCKSYFAAAMKMEVRSPPQAILEAATAALLEVPDIDLPNDAIGSPEDPIWKKDKIFFVTVRRDSGPEESLAANTDRWMIVAIEFDCRTRMWGHAHRVRNVELSRLDRAIPPAIFEVFRCIGRIKDHDKKQKQVTLEMRAGLLAGLSQAKTIPAANSVLQPVIRRTGRRGKPGADLASAVQWTLLRVERAAEDLKSASALPNQNETTSGNEPVTQSTPDESPEGELKAEIAAGKVRCRIESGLNSPLRMRTSRGAEKLALLVTPLYEQTVFELRNVEPPHDPLLGYEIHARLPEEKTLVKVGRSSWDGNIVIAKDDHPFKIYYVKHGEVLLARLPYAAGLEPTISIPLVDHRERLMAEAFINGVQDQLLDLVVRREMVAAQIRRLVEKEDVAGADIRRATDLMSEVQRLNRPDELVQLIESREAKFRSDNASVQRRIDLMFSQLRRDVQKTISASYVQKLQNAVEQAKLRLPKPKAKPES